MFRLLSANHDAIKALKCGVVSAIVVGAVTAVGAEDAASLMAGALKDFDPLRDWTSLSVVKGKELRAVKGKIKVERSEDDNWHDGEADVREIQGRGLYVVRWSMKVDKDAYFKRFLPHFKQVLSKIQVGEAKECILTLPQVEPKLFHAASHTFVAGDDGRQGMMFESIDEAEIFQPFISSVGVKTRPKVLDRYYVSPIVLPGFPRIGNDGKVEYKNVAVRIGGEEDLTEIKGEHPYDIWVLDGMDGASLRCSVYKVPAYALRAYREILYGELVHALNALDAEPSDKLQKRVEVRLLDDKGKKVAGRTVDVIALDLTCGILPDLFAAFFIRPMFTDQVYDFSKVDSDKIRRYSCFSSEIQRDMYFSLTDGEFKKVKRVKVRFVGSGRKRK